MARKIQLREMHYNTVLNKTSKGRESSLSGTVARVACILRWPNKEMFNRCIDIARRDVLHYLSKYDADAFERSGEVS